MIIIVDPPGALRSAGLLTAQAAGCAGDTERTVAFVTDVKSAREQNNTVSGHIFKINAILQRFWGAWKLTKLKNVHFGSDFNVLDYAVFLNTCPHRTWYSRPTCSPRGSQNVKAAEMSTGLRKSSLNHNNVSVAHQFKMIRNSLEGNLLKFPACVRETKRCQTLALLFWRPDNFRSHSGNFCALDDLLLCPPSNWSKAEVCNQELKWSRRVKQTEMKRSEPAGRLQAASHHHGQTDIHTKHQALSSDSGVNVDGLLF